MPAPYGSMVVVRGLQSAPEHNGKVGKVMSWELMCKCRALSIDIVSDALRNHWRQHSSVQCPHVVILFLLPAEYWPSCWQEPLLAAY